MCQIVTIVWLDSTNQRSRQSSCVRKTQGRFESLKNGKEKCSPYKTLFKVDALMNALYSPSSHQYSNTIISFFPKIIQLNTLLDQAINNQDQESLLGKCFWSQFASVIYIFEGLSKIICGLGENHCRIVLSKIDHGGMEIIKMILKVTQMPLQYPTEESCSPVSFSFWYSLQDEFESMTMELQQNWGPLIHHLFFELIKGISIF